MPLEFEERERLIRSWCHPELAQKLVVPTDHEWQSTDGQESQLVLAWTGEHFSNAWGLPIVERLAARLGGDRGVWGKHGDALLETCCGFFGRWASRTILNAVTATPSRTRFRYWAPAGRFVLKQDPEPKLAIVSGIPDLSAAGLGGDLRLPMNSWLWAGSQAQRPHTVLWQTHRRYRGTAFAEWRAFGANWEEDSAALKAGRLPELDAIIMADGNGRRAPTPMIHFWRVEADGLVEMLVIEIDIAGKLVSLRWSQQPFASFMLAHVWYFDALREALGTRQRLFRP